MQFRQDILRGLRFGAILLAVFFAGVAVYRLVRESPPATRAIEKPATPAPEVQPVKPTPAPAAPLSAAVPPPPAVSTKARKAIAKPADGVVAVVEAAAVKVNAEETVDGVEDKPPQAAADDKDSDSPPAPRGASALLPAADDESSPKSAGRGKRLLKAVGRFLHIAKPPQAPE